MNFDDSVMEKLRIKYKETSVQMCRKACKYFYKYWLKSDENVFNPDLFIKKKTSFYNFIKKSSNKKLCCSYLALLKSVLIAYGKDISKLKRIENLRKTFVNEEKEKTIKRVSVKDKIEDIDIEKILKTLKNNSIFNETEYLKYILVKMLSECPHRLSEIALLEYKKNKEDDNNYIDIKNKKIVLNEHKNSKRTNQKKESNISDELLNEIINFKNKFGNKKWVFPKRKDSTKHREPIQLSHLLNNTLGKGKGIRYLRHLCDSKKVKELDISKEQLLQLIEQSEKMGHSIKTLILHYLQELDI